MKQHSTIKTATTCDYCPKLIIDEDYHLIDINDKQAFQHPYTKDIKKMCRRCWNQLSQRKRTNVTLDQIDAFPDYPTENFISNKA